MLIALLEIKCSFVFYRVMLVSVPQSLHSQVDHSHPSSSQSRIFVSLKHTFFTHPHHNLLSLLAVLAILLLTGSFFNAAENSAIYF